MNYYAQGGQAHGIKSLAQELPKYGRYNDDMVAHISSDEARLLKSLGGSGTINPVTGLPEFGLGSIIKSVVRPVQQVYNATLKNIPGVDKALVGLDKGIGSIIPGGWGTLASIAGSAVGLPTWALTGLGGLTGSGVLKKDGKFNLQGALMGGAMAYGMSQLGEAARAADIQSGIPTDSITAANVSSDPIGNLNSSQMFTGDGAALANTPAFDPSSTGGFSYTPSGEMVPSNISPNITGATPTAPVNATPSFIDKGISNLQSTGRGLANLSGLSGPEGTAAAARAAAVNPITQGGMTALAMGTIGTMQLDEQQKALDAQLASGNIAQSEYDAQAARIADARARAEQAVRDNPYQFAKGGEVPGYFDGGSLGAIMARPEIVQVLMSPEQRTQAQSKQLTDMGIKQNIVDSANSTQLQDYLNAMRKSDAEKSAYRSMINNPYQYAVGGSVDDEYGMDEARGLMQGNLQNGFMGGGMPSYAKGGETKERRNYLDMMDAELRMPPSARYVEGIGFEAPPTSVGGRVGANFDALGGNIRAGVSGNAMMGQDRRIMARPEMMDIGYKGQVGPGELDVGLQRAIQSMPGRAKDYALNAKYSMNFADGGNVSTPRFLSGGGDGMSDSIPATINGKQEARLSTSEFVVPADVVSHLGNGSSQAGAKQLYAMMDRVRSARTGKKKQAPEINSRKLMPA